MRFLFVLLSLVLGAGCHASPLPISLVPTSAPAKFDRPFFGMHVHNSGSLRNWPDIPIGSIRLWDAYVNWASLEPQQGVWQFARLDEYVSWAEDHGVDILLPLGVTPKWASARPGEKGAYGWGSAAEPSDIENWRNYVRTVVHRYRGRIGSYQVWNEANLPEFYTGSMASLVALIRVAGEEIRNGDPNAILVAPSGQGLDGRESWTSRLLAEGAGNLVDVLSYHLYHAPAAPENMIAPVLRMKGLNAAAGYAAKPFWNTESGYWTPNPFEKWSRFESKSAVTLNTAAMYLPRDLFLARALGFERYFWYAWDNKKMGFRDPNTGMNRPIAAVLEQFFTILMRSTLHRCDRNSVGLWNCKLTGANGKPLVALWIDPLADLQQQQVVAPLPGKWMLLDGDSQWQPASAYLNVGPTVIVVSDQK